MTAADRRGRTERAALLGLAGLALAAIQQFGPLLWPYGLGAWWSPVTQAWTLAIDLLWVASMVIAYQRDPASPLWKLLLAYRVVATAGVLWVFPTSLTWTISNLIVGLGGVVFVHLVLAFPSGHLEDRLDRRFVLAAYAWFAVTRVAWLLVWQPPTTRIGFSPRNPFVSAPDSTLAWLFGPFALVLLAAALFAGVVVGLTRHWRRAGPVERRALLPMALAAPVQLALTRRMAAGRCEPIRVGRAAGGAAVPGPRGRRVAVPRRLPVGARARPAGEGRRGRPRRGARARRAAGRARGGTCPRPRGRVRSCSAFPAPSGDGLVRADGRSVHALPDVARRASRRLERNGELLAVLDYDPAIEREDPDASMRSGRSRGSRSPTSAWPPRFVPSSRRSGRRGCGSWRLLTRSASGSSATSTTARSSAWSRSPFASTRSAAGPPARTR